MKIGILKSKVEKFLVESMSNNTFKSEIKTFKSLVLEDKDIAKAFYIYDVLDRKRGMSKDDANSLIDESFIANLNLQTILINNSWGGLFKNLDILLDGLKSNQISFLGLDVVPEEPPNINNNFFKALKDSSNDISSRIILTPHLSYYSEQSWPEMRTKAALNIKRALNGLTPLNIVNWI